MRADAASQIRLLNREYHYNNILIADALFEENKVLSLLKYLKDEGYDVDISSSNDISF